MLNTQKLLYIFPDVAYIAELLPGKKPTTFTVHAFRQINGEFMDDNEFIGENILKLITKIDPEEYHLVLPDFLFTNTIVTVQEKSDTKIKTYLKDTLLPQLELSNETHYIDTTILTEHGNSSKVQLSALEKSVLEPLQVSVEQSKVKISGVSPLSWTIKSLVSLEPSISVVQMGTMLYTALHYIGVDQTTQANVDEVENIFETIKTLKGTEPSIQTVYLLSNELVEEKLKEHLSDTLPIQQIATQSDEETKMPSYVQKTIEAGMRTLNIDEYPVPKFDLGKAPAGASIVQTDRKEVVEIEEDTDELPKPTVAAPVVIPAVVKPEPVVAAEVEELAVEEEDEALEEVVPEKEVEIVEEEETVSKVDDDIDSLLASLQIDEPKPTLVTKTTHATTPTHNPTQTTHTPTPIIRNNNRTKTMLKMIFVTLAVFFATVGIGIGLGLGVLQLSQNKTTDEPTSPIVATSPSPTPQPSPSPSPSPSPIADKSEIDILIVNATTKAGYAGQQATKLKAAEFTSVSSGNAKGEYETGNFVLMEEENKALISELEEATGLALTYQAKNKETEDPTKRYEVVIVLAEE
jgi:hypothetical protein